MRSFPQGDTRCQLKAFHLPPSPRGSSGVREEPEGGKARLRRPGRSPCEAASPGSSPQAWAEASKVQEFDGLV